LIKAVTSGSGKFFLGSDSAPHDISAKKGGRGKTSAGVFTQPNLVGLVMGALEQAIERKVISEEDVTEDILKGFMGGYGRAFYGVEEGHGERIVLQKDCAIIQESIKGDGVEVVPFRRGQSTWSVEWK
jgi:dihydroorotase